METTTLENVKLILYAVRNKEGKWFRSKGQNGYGKSWVDSIENAKIYTKIGQARSRVSFWANAFPDYGIPDLIKIHATSFEVVEETTRVKKVKEKKDKAEAERNLRHKKWEVERAEKELADAQNRLKNLKK